MFIILFGPPGSGKGTQSERLAREYNLAHCNMGELLRNIAAHNSQLKQLLAAGNLVSDEYVFEVLQHYINTLPAPLNCILDGYPRSMWQLSALQQLINLHQTSAIYISLEVPDVIVTQRLLKRQVCDNCNSVANIDVCLDNHCSICGTQLKKRDDDDASVIAKRLHLHHSIVDPIISECKKQNTVYTIDANMPADQVYSAINDILFDDFMRLRITKATT